MYEPIINLVPFSSVDSMMSQANQANNNFSNEVIDYAHHANQVQANVDTINTRSDYVINHYQTFYL